MNSDPPSFSNRGKSNPTGKKICALVCVVHIFVFLSLALKAEKRVPAKKNTIAVRTVSSASGFHAEVKTASQSSSSSTVNVPVPEKKQTPPPTPVPKKQTPPPQKVPRKKTPPPSPPKKQDKSSPKKPPPKKASEIKSDEIAKSLKEIEETIAKIASKSDRIPSKHTGDISAKLEPLENPLEIEEKYVSSLISYLEEALRLPDLGEVKIELTLRCNGTPEKIKILSAESEKNRKRLEESLLRLQFPPFPKEEKGIESKMFLLIFCNDF